MRAIGSPFWLQWTHAKQAEPLSICYGPAIPEFIW
jgi:hypothetical protein